MHCFVFPTLSQSALIALVVLGVLVLLVLLVLAGSRYRLWLAEIAMVDFQSEIESMVAAGDMDPKVAEAGRVPRELNRVHVELVEKIGSGAFGEVYRGLLDESSVSGLPGHLVAVKTAIDSTNATRELICEAAVMAQVPNHKNLVSLVGVVSRRSPMLLVLRCAFALGSMRMLCYRVTGILLLYWVTKSNVD